MPLWRRPHLRAADGSNVPKMTQPLMRSIESYAVEHLVFSIFILLSCDYYRLMAQISHANLYVV